MQRHYVCLLLVIVSFLWISCSPQDAPVDEPKYFVEELAILDLTLKDWLNDMLADFGDEMDELEVDDIIDFIDRVLSPKLRIVAISYNTRDHFGNPVLGTGCFVYPLELKPKGVVEMTPIGDLDQETSPTLVVEKGNFYIESFPSLFNYITITPDMLGVRYTRHMPRPVMLDHNSGLVAYHMRKAVEEYLLIKENYRMSNRSIIIGYSHGGPTALSLAKYYSQNPTGIKIDMVYTGGGPYDGIEAFKAFARTERNDYPAIPWIPISMNYYYQLDLDFSKIFTNGMENPIDSPDPLEGGDGYAYWFNGAHWSSKLRNRWGNDLRYYMHPDFFSGQLKGEFLKMQECLEENSIALNWTPPPLLEIHLLHGSEDTFVPVECSDFLYKTYKEKGCSIQYERITGNHHEAGFEFIKKAALYLLLK
ncbi:MAG: hypothetical protein GX877_00570 [Bacteroidales bacterium]|nr:hypothetical protein [Bacteroidales bacterium]